MENIINIDYFVGELTIPNLNKDEGDNFETTYINRYQKDYLIKVLGYSMFKDFETALSEETPDVKWTNLLNGVDYDVIIDGETVLTKWNGFTNNDNVSPIAYYVYRAWINKNYAQLTGTGVGVSNKENASNYPLNFKSVSAQNNEIDLTGNLRKYLYSNTYKYIKRYKNSKYYREDLTFVDDSVKLDQSLFMYLYHHRDDFTNWIFTNETKQNVFGI